MQISNYHFKGSIDGYVVEGECETEYYTDEREDIPRRKTMVFSDVTITDKKTGEADYCDEEIPDAFLNMVRDIAEDCFEVA
jgi:hypothetical protein